MALDETLIIHENNKQIWLAGFIDTATKAVRIDIIPSRTSQNIEIFVRNHILPGTHIAHDGWAGYSFLDDDDVSVWTHETHTHAVGDFGYGLNSTSHIEQFWGQLKAIIKKVYYIIPKKDFIYYITRNPYSP